MHISTLIDKTKAEPKKEKDIGKCDYLIDDVEITENNKYFVKLLTGKYLGDTTTV